MTIETDRVGICRGLATVVAAVIVGSCSYDSTSYHDMIDSLEEADVDVRVVKMPIAWDAKKVELEFNASTDVVNDVTNTWKPGIDNIKGIFGYNSELLPKKVYNQCEDITTYKNVLLYLEDGTYIHGEVQYAPRNFSWSAITTIYHCPSTNMNWVYHAEV